MKYAACALLLCATLGSSAQVLNFYGTEYYLSPDASYSPGTALSASGTDLSGFNYSWTDFTHPIFTTGLYYPVQDCGGSNLWVRVQHVAHDPNGYDNGYNIAQTLNSPFLPAGSTDRIGGWAGFLYDFVIFADANLTGERSYVLAEEHPTSITVESLETLYNDGGTMYEWLSFEIINQGSTGWTLNSINFTGTNPYSNPGFSEELNYSTTATFSEPPLGFYTAFPAGADSIYAIDLNLSSSYHSEFRMSAGAVSHFRYGYEFHNGGYQGMSMAFGGGPVVSDIVAPVACFGEDVEATIVASGNEPMSYDWSTGDSEATITVGPGTYTVEITDANGCVSSATVEVTESTAITGEIQLTLQDGLPLLYITVSGGTGSYTYTWNDGSTDAMVYPTASGTYTVTVTDGNGCTLDLEFLYVGVEENTPSVRPYPNPTSGQLFVHGTPGDRFRVFDTQGRCVFDQLLQRTVQIVDLSALAPGHYVYRSGGTEGKLVVH